MKKHVIILCFIVSIAVVLFSACDLFNEKEPDATPDGSDHIHIFSEDWDRDDEYHWHSSICEHHLQKDKALHEFGNESVLIEPTETSEGQKIRVCSVCGFVKFDVIEKTTVERQPSLITFDLDGGRTSYINMTKSVSELNAKDFFFDLKKDGYKFRGWAYNGIKVFDENRHLVNEVEMESNMTFVAVYSDTLNVTITTNMPEAGEYTVSEGREVNGRLDLSARAAKGYKFVCWEVNGNVYSTEQDDKYEMWDQDIDLVVVFDYAEFSLSLTSYDPERGLVLVNPQNVAYSYQRTYALNHIKYKSSVTAGAKTIGNDRFIGWFDKDDNLVSTNEQ